MQLCSGRYIDSSERTISFDNLLKPENVQCSVILADRSIFVTLCSVQAFGDLNVWLAAENGMYLRPPYALDGDEVRHFGIGICKRCIFSRLCMAFPGQGEASQATDCDGRHYGLFIQASVSASGAEQTDFRERLYMLAAHSLFG